MLNEYRYIYIVDLDFDRTPPRFDLGGSRLRWGKIPNPEESSKRLTLSVPGVFKLHDVANIDIDGAPSASHRRQKKIS